MSVEDVATVDMIGNDGSTGEVVLTISDHLSWEEAGHLLKLQDKLNAYLQFIESGQLLAQYPKARDRRARICVICRFQPTEDGRRFLDEASRVIEQAGVGFRHEVFRTDGNG